MIETEECPSKFKILPEADDYKLEVLKVSEKIPAGNTYKRDWQFVANSEKAAVFNEEVTLSLFPKTDLLIALGGIPKPNKPNSIDIDFSKVIGRRIECTVTIEKSPKKSKITKEVIPGEFWENNRISNVKEYIPF